MKKFVTQGFWILIVIFIICQFIQIERTNPPVTGTIDAPKEVMAILKRSCFDCHSNETKWPWYSYVAPVSWLVGNDVHAGRKHMNFSEWDTYNERRRNHKIKECGEEVTEGEMPLWFYIPLHPEAALLPEDIQTIVAWSEQNQ